MKNLLTIFTLMIFININAKSLPLDHNDEILILQEYLNGQLDQDQVIKATNPVVPKEKLLPMPVGLAGDTSNFGESLSVYENIAVIGAPNMDSHGLVYVYEYDGVEWVQQAVIRPNDGESEDQFGISVSVFEDKILIGASNKTVDGHRSQGVAYLFEKSNNKWNQTYQFSGSRADIISRYGNTVILLDDKAYISAHRNRIGSSDNGDLYFYQLDNNEWVEKQIITPTDNSTAKNFGQDFSIDGKRMVVSAPTDRINGTSSGSAFIFEYENDQWIEKQRITPEDGASRDLFGFSVDLNGDTIIVGAPRNEDLGDDSGSAYVFEKEGEVWVEKTKLLASDGLEDGLFGATVKIDLQNIYVGAYGKNNRSNDAGAIYLFSQSGDQWNETGFISPDDAEVDDQFSISMALFDRGLFVGSLLDDDNGVHGGGVYVIERDNTDWVQIQKMNSNTDIGAMNDLFGFSVSYDGNRVAIGSPRDDTNGYNSGSVYIFDKINEQWQFTQKVYSDQISDGQFFGFSVSLNGDKLIVGAPDGNTFAQVGQGKAYVYHLESDQWQLHQVLTPSDEVDNQLYGYAVKIFNNTAIVTAPRNVAGAAYIFKYENNTWQQSQSIGSSDNMYRDYFGISVDMNETRMVIGADNQRHELNLGDESGAVHVFEIEKGKWSRTHVIFPPEFSEYDGIKFGGSVSLYEDTLLIGSREDVTKIFSITTETGSAYIYELVQNVWEYQQRLLPDILRGFDRFGISVMMNENVILVGASRFSNRLSLTGAVFVYFKHDRWELSHHFNANDSELADQFGFAMSLVDDELFVGAYSDNTISGTNSGSVYFFEVNEHIFSSDFEGE